MSEYVIDIISEIKSCIYIYLLDYCNMQSDAWHDFITVITVVVTDDNMNVVLRLLSYVWTFLSESTCALWVPHSNAFHDDLMTCFVIIKMRPKDYTYLPSQNLILFVHWHRLRYRSINMTYWYFLIYSQNCCVMTDWTKIFYYCRATGNFKWFEFV